MNQYDLTTKITYLNKLVSDLLRENINTRKFKFIFYRNTDNSVETHIELSDKIFVNDNIDEAIRELEITLVKNKSKPKFKIGQEVFVFSLDDIVSCMVKDIIEYVVDDKTMHKYTLEKDGRTQPYFSEDQLYENKSEAIQKAVKAFHILRQP